MIDKAKHTSLLKAKANDGVKSFINFFPILLLKQFGGKFKDFFLKETTQNKVEFKLDSSDGEIGRALQFKYFLPIGTRGHSYKTFYGCDLRIFVIS